MQIRPDGTAALPSTRTPDLLQFEVADDPDHHGTTVVHLYGEVDHSNAWLVAGLVEGATLAGARAIRLDLTGLRFADSSLVSALDACAPSLEATGTRVHADRATDCVARVFALLDAHRYLTD